MTATRRPAKRPRSACSLEWLASSGGRPSNSAGRHANSAIPAATTTRSLSIGSSSSRTTRKPGSSRVTDTTWRGSISGTACAWNHSPYATKSARGIGRLIGLPRTRSNSSSVYARAGSAMRDALQLLLRHIPLGMCRFQNDMVLPKTRTSAPAARRCDAAASPYGPAPMTTASTADRLMGVSPSAVCAASPTSAARSPAG